MSDAPLLFLDANALASPVTRTLLIAGARADGLRWTWSRHVEVEADRHVRGQASRTSIVRPALPEYPKGDDADSLVVDYLAGIPVGRIAEKYGVHRSTVTAHLRRREIPAVAAGLDRRQRAEALRLCREGLSLREVGRRMGVDRKLVRAALVAEGDEIRTGLT